MKLKNLLVLTSFFLVLQAFGHIKPEDKVTEKPQVIILNLSSTLWSGITTHVLNLYKTLEKNGYPVAIFSNKSSPSRLNQALKELNTSIQQDSELLGFLENICKQNKQVFILCNKREDLIRAQKIKRSLSSYSSSFSSTGLPIKIIFFQHMDDIQNIHNVQELKDINCVVGISQNLVDTFNTLNTEHNLTIQKIVSMQPFFDEERFLNFSTTQTQKLFFKQEFNIDTQDLPVICSIGNMYSNLNFKNHPLLFKAVRKIIVEKKKPMHLILVGSGARMEYLKKMARELEINNFVHFVGFSQKTPDILYHSDFHVLASSNESFGIVHLEAGLMKKPSIGATGTGAESIIRHESTGLLFENNNLDDLAEKIELLIDQPSYRKILGNNAYYKIQENFSNSANLLKLEQIFKSIV